MEDILNIDLSDDELMNTIVDDHSKSTGKVTNKRSNVREKYLDRS